MANTKNALAELAEQLEAVHEICTRDCAEETCVGKVVSKAQRIVAELAKVLLYESVYCKGFFTADVNTVDVILKCRAIAEEGGAI